NFEKPDHRHALYRRASWTFFQGIEGIGISAESKWRLAPSKVRVFFAVKLRSRILQNVVPPVFGMWRKITVFGLVGMEPVECSGGWIQLIFARMTVVPAL